MRRLKALLTLLVITAAFTGTARAEPLLIRNSYVVPVSDWEPLMVEKKDLAKHWGKSYVMEAVRYQGTPPMITALANGELEIANLAYSTLGIAIAKRRHQRSPRHLRRIPRRRSRPLLATSSSSARTPASRPSPTSRARCSPPT